MIIYLILDKYSDKFIALATDPQTAIEIAQSFPETECNIVKVKL